MPHLQGQPGAPKSPGNGLPSAAGRLTHQIFKFINSVAGIGRAGGWHYTPDGTAMRLHNAADGRVYQLTLSLMSGRGDTGPDRFADDERPPRTIGGIIPEGPIGAPVMYGGALRDHQPPGWSLGPLAMLGGGGDIAFSAKAIHESGRAITMILADSGQTISFSGEGV